MPLVFRKGYSKGWALTDHLTDPWAWPRALAAAYGDAALRRDLEARAKTLVGMTYERWKQLARPGRARGFGEVSSELPRDPKEFCSRRLHADKFKVRPLLAWFHGRQNGTRAVWRPCLGARRGLPSPRRATKEQLRERDARRGT